MGVLEGKFEDNVMITSLDWLINWARSSSPWPLSFGLACCAIEMINLLAVASPSPVTG